MALRGDPISAYGGIVGFNTELEEKTALEMSSMFFDVIIAPSYTMKALKILNKKKNTRILTSNFQEEFFQFRTINGGLLYQEIDNKKDLIKNWDFVTKNKPNKNEIKNWAFAWECTKFVKSNAIIITSEKSIIGIGSGQPNRINSVNLAIEKAKSHLTENSILASDAFFPFSDSIELASKNNIRNIIQPGGSIRDHEVISEANRHNIKMIFTNTRHFSH
jgi:phosphoribosylaminoimidazolecarboxamide formyltransferase/IMP cyclohydrolase